MSIAGHAENGRLAAEWDTSQITATKKICLVGRAPSSMNLAPYDDPSWEIWSLASSAANNELPRWDRWFELHDLDLGHERWAQACPGYWSWLKTDHGKPIYIAAPHPDLPHGVVYPWKEVIDRFGRYFNNSVSLMIAVAIIEGATDLSLYGIDMAQSDPVVHGGTGEYQHQRPSCEYMVGVAIGCGLRVVVPPESDLLKTARIYGLESDIGESARKHAARAKELNDRKNHAVQQMNAHKQEARNWEMIAAKFDGAIEDNDYWKQRII